MKDHTGLGVRATFVVWAMLGALAFAVAASAAPVPRDPPAKAALGSREGAQMKSVVMVDDATKSRGSVASGGSAEATIFLQPNDSGFGWFMKSDDVFGYGTWAAEMVFANGFLPGDSISSYHMRFYHSTFEDIAGLGGNDAEVSTQLWDGDPFSIMDTGCTAAGVSAPIAGTQAVFSGIPWGTVVDLTAVFPGKPVVNCDRVWGEMTFVRGCRGAWRLSGEFTVSSFTVPADVGFMNGVWLMWACEQFTACNTPNGYNSGTCCNDPGTVCDHTDDVFECDPFGTDPGAQPSFCGDGAADYFVADYHVEGMFEGYVATVNAPTDTVVSLVVVSVDAPPSGGSAAGVISLSEDEVVLQGGNHNVWLEFRVGDWDPDDVGVQLAAWQLALDSSGYASGDQGELTVYTGFGCAGPGDNGPCESVLGPGATCDPPGYFFPAGTCSFAFIDTAREDYVYKDAGQPIITVDVSVPDARPVGTVISGPPDDPPCVGCTLAEFPAGGMYAATLTLYVPSNAKGTFGVGMKPWPATQLVDQNSQFIPLIGLESTKITVQTGRCCFNLQDPSGGECLDVLQTAETCAQMPGTTDFAADGTCDEPCVDIVPCCLADQSCTMEERDFCTDVLGGEPSNSGLECAGSARACCETNDTCNMADPACCAGGIGAIPGPPGSVCAEAEACCLPGGGCEMLDPTCCSWVQQGTPQGPGSTCGEILEACCLEDGSCTNADATCCIIELDGTPSGSGLLCAGDNDGGGVDDACQSVGRGRDCFDTAPFELAFKLLNDPDALDPTDPEFYPDVDPADGEPDFLPLEGVIVAPKADSCPVLTIFERLDDLLLLGDPPLTETIGANILFENDPDAVCIDCNEGEVSFCSVIPFVRTSTSETVLIPIEVLLTQSGSPGEMSVTKTHQNGGTFTLDSLSLDIEITFGIDDSDGNRLVHKAQAVPISISGPWVHALSPGNLAEPCGTNFAPGVVEDPSGSGTQCCRDVLVGGAGVFQHQLTAHGCTALCSDGACCNFETSSCDLVDVTACTGDFKGRGTDCRDSDGDGLADWIESPGGGFFPIDECNTSTDAQKTDTDGDGCSDLTDPDPLDPCVPEGGCPPFDDCQNPPNDIPDSCELARGVGDCDGNGVLDDCGTDLDRPGACCNGLHACGAATRAECEASGFSFRGICEACPDEGGGVANHNNVVVRHFPSSLPPLEVCVDGSGGSAAFTCIDDPEQLIDAWETVPDVEMCHEFSSVHTCSPPIPLNFFGPNSDAFEGFVCLEGVALRGVFGEADTKVRRLADPFDRCDLPSVDPSPVEAELVALSLKSVASITVTFNGGQGPEEWDVSVDLSTVAPPGVSVVTATKTHCRGGVYSSSLIIQPRFTFTKVDDPLEVRVLDTGLAGNCPIVLIQEGADAEPWVTELDPGVASFSPFCTDFHPGIEALEPVVDCDCNDNGRWDVCDVEECPEGDAACQDCNANDVPDECELAGNDCNANAIPDDCESDCNQNGVPDECDIDPSDPDGNGLVSADCTRNGIPDECEADCNENGVADTCDIAQCPPEDPSCDDCNGNGVPDECELDCNANEIADVCEIAANPAIDLNENGIIDVECEPFPPPPTGACCSASQGCLDGLTADLCFGIEGKFQGGESSCDEEALCLCVRAAQPTMHLLPNAFGTELPNRKGRMLPVIVSDVGRHSAIRVEFVDLPDPYHIWNGKLLWATPPVSVCETGIVGAGPCDVDTYVASQLACGVGAVEDWGSMGVINLWHEGIVPNGLYRVQVLDETCNATFPGNFSDALDIQTAIYGDIVEDCSVLPCPPAEGVVNIIDPLSSILVFQSAPGKPSKSRADLSERCIDGKSNIVDVLHSVNGFNGLPYPETPSTPDACDSICLPIAP